MVDRIQKAGAVDIKGIKLISIQGIIVDLKDYNLGIALLRKGDESSLYLTRDLAAAIYRHEHLGFSKMGKWTLLSTIMIQLWPFP